MIITKTFTRQSENTDFYFSADFNQHLSANYLDAGKIQLATKIGPLTREVKMVMSEETLAEFGADPVVIAYSAARDAYNQAHGILTADHQEAS